MEYKYGVAWKSAVELDKLLREETNLFKAFPSLLDQTDYVATPTQATSMFIALGLWKLDQMSAILVWGQSGSGKTALCQQLLKLVDHDRKTDRIIEHIDTSPEWLKYAAGESGDGLQHKIIFGDEINPARLQQHDRRQELWRQIHTTDARYATFAIVERKEGGFAERQLRVKLPIHLLNTTVTSPTKWDEQHRSRCFFVPCDSTPEQVEEALKRVANSPLDSIERSALYAGVSNFYNGLRGQSNEYKEAFADIDVPFMDELLIQHSSPSGMHIRRFKMLKQCIKASAILHQYHREVRNANNGADVLIATWDDFHNVLAAFEEFVPSMTNVSSLRALETLRKIAPLLGNSPRNKYEIVEASKIKQRLLEEHLPELVSAGLLNEVDRRRDGDRRTYYKLGDKILSELDKRHQRHPITGQVLQSGNIAAVVDTVIAEMRSDSWISAKSANDREVSSAGLKGTDRAASSELRNSAWSYESEDDSTEQEPLRPEDFD